MKKELSVIIMLMTSMLSFALDVKIGNIRYALDDSNKTAQVIRDNYSGDIVIPRSITYENNEYLVTSIYGGHGSTDMIYNYGAFYSCNLSSLTIPPSIKSIGGMAFYGCKIEKLYISDLITWCGISFDIYQFHQCVELSSNPLYCNPLFYINGEYVEDLVIPEEVKKISSGAFTGPQFKTVLLHKGITSVSDDAFRGCSNLMDIYSYCPQIAESAFFVNDINHQFEKTNVTLHIRERYSSNYNWTKIKEIKYIDGIDFRLVYKIDDKEYKNVWYEVGEPITPEVEPTKEGHSFSGWSEIPETMPDHDVTVTGSFSPNTYKLTYFVDGELYKVVEVKCDEAITAEPDPTKKGMTFSGWSIIPEKMPAKDVTVTGTFSWSNIINGKIIYQVTDTINNYAAVIGNKGASGGLTIASDVEFDYNYKVTTIADRAFNGCKGITTIDIPATITNLGERTFAGIDKLTDVTISAEDVPTTDRTAFENSYIDYVTLHVPAGSVEKYKATGPWKNFKEIVPIEGGQTKIVSIHSVDKQKASYNLNGIKISKTNKTAKGIIIRAGKKYGVSGDRFLTQEVLAACCRFLSLPCSLDDSSVNAC